MPFLALESFVCSLWGGWIIFEPHPNLQMLLPSTCGWDPRKTIITRLVGHESMKLHMKLHISKKKTVHNEWWEWTCKINWTISKPSILLKLVCGKKKLFCKSRCHEQVLRSRTGGILSRSSRPSHGSLESAMQDFGYRWYSQATKSVGKKTPPRFEKVCSILVPTQLVKKDQWHVAFLDDGWRIGTWSANKIKRPTVLAVLHLKGPVTISSSRVLLMVEASTLRITAYFLFLGFCSTFIIYIYTVHLQFLRKSKKSMKITAAKDNDNDIQWPHKGVVGCHGPSSCDGCILRLNLLHFNIETMPCRKKLAKCKDGSHSAQDLQ